MYPHELLNHTEPHHHSMVVATPVLPAYRKRHFSHVEATFPAVCLHREQEQQGDDNDDRLSASDVLDVEDSEDLVGVKRAKVEIRSAPCSPVSVDAATSKPSTPLLGHGATNGEPAMTPTRKTARPNMSASHSITLDMLRPHFEQPLAHVAKSFGICVTLLKKICRKHGISRWPHRQITGLRKSIASMEHAIGYFEGARRDSYAEQLHKQKTKLALLLEDPTKCSSSSTSSASSCSSRSHEEDDSLASLSPSPQLAPMRHGMRHGSPVSNGYATTPTEMDHMTHPSCCAPEYFAPSAPRISNFPRPPIRASPSLPPVQQPPRPYYSRECGGAGMNAAVPIYLPPLRPENRRMLPSIASLVSNNSANW